MPIYEYRCAACGFQKEYLQKLSDPVLTDCPECKKPAFNKLLSAAGFQLKGSGWYATDFKGGGAKPAAGTQSANEAGKSDKSDKSDKPAEATASAHACGSGACGTCS